MGLSEDEKRAKILDMCLFDDVFFEVAAEDIKACEEIIQTILENDTIKVLKVSVQKEERVVGGRSIRVDALCELEDGSLCNIEIQQADNVNHIKRTRYYSSVITAASTDPGITFDDIKTLYIIYISRKDIFHMGKTIYHVDNVIKETGTPIDDGLHRIFVNAEVNDHTNISELMEGFKTPDFQNQKFPNVTSRIKHIRYGEGGIKVMTKSQELINEGKLEEQVEVYKKCIDEGMSKEKALYISGLPEDKIPKE